LDFRLTIEEHAELAFALEFVKDACALAQCVQAALAGASLEKADLSPVTVADLAVQALAGKRLAVAFPADTLVGEESSGILRGPNGEQALEQAVRFTSLYAPDATPDNICTWIDHGAGEPGARYWTLDPVDGTKGFLRGDQYAIALALVENGRVILGALGCPNLDPTGQPQRGDGLIALALRGEGAWSHPVSGRDFTRLRVSPEAKAAPARVLRSYEKAHTNASETDLIMQALGIEAAAVTMDSQAKYATLAAGHAEVLLRLLNPGKEDYKERIWDQAAGSIVLEEAGGTITDLLGQRLDFSVGRTLAHNTGVLASNGPLHESALEAIQSVCKL
jgi:3'(2'), 5'-bisphosphate nucleotidase